MSVLMDPALQISFDYCRDLTRREARNFYYGMKLTPEPKRSAMYAIYAWMRTADDLADSHPPQSPATPVAGPATKTGSDPVSAAGPTPDAITAFSAMTDQALADQPVAGPVQLHAPMWPALRHVLRTYPIDGRLLHEMIAGQCSDSQNKSVAFATFDDLYQYCYRVASVVGLISVAIWGHDDDSRVGRWAEQRGIAFQLTNILRDVKEDAQLGRIYLPREDLARFNYDADKLKRGEADQSFDELMRFQITRARDFYERSSPLEEHLSPDCRSTCLTLCRIYRALLERIAAHPRKVLQGRVSVPTVKKLAISLRGKFGK
ncbi:MAG: phytoene/squalene synthase family protein [Phycisphaeraceae bacterium]|nr:phytoene/squalene synthase family protein [Phycisphaeraceae bacterium]